MITVSRQARQTQHYHVNVRPSTLTHTTEKAELEVRSTTSRTSRSSATSVVLAAATARAKTEASQDRPAFANKEIEVKLEKARLEATLHALEKEGEAQAAAAEAAVMEAATASLETSVEHPIHLSQMQSSDERTAEYVRKHNNPSDNKQSQVIAKDHKVDKSMHTKQFNESDMEEENVSTVPKKMSAPAAPRNH